MGEAPDLATIRNYLTVICETAGSVGEAVKERDWAGAIETATAINMAVDRLMVELRKGKEFA